MVYCLVFMSSNWTTAAVMLKTSLPRRVCLVLHIPWPDDKAYVKNVAMVMNSDCVDLAGQHGRRVERGP